MLRILPHLEMGQFLNRYFLQQQSYKVTTFMTVVLCFWWHLSWVLVRVDLSMSQCLNYRPQTKLREGYVFYRCLWFCSWGVCPIACWDTHPLGTRGRHPPGTPPIKFHKPHYQGCKWTCCSPRQVHPPGAMHAGIWSTSGRYIRSHRNAILLFLSLFVSTRATGL